VRSDFLPPSLERDERGLWRCESGTAISYPETGNADLIAVEDASFWFQHRNRCITSAVRRFPPGGPIVDVGAGNGYVARGLKNAGFEVVAVEPGITGALAAQQRGIECVICAAIQDIGLGEAAIPAAGLFDVLEHIEDDVGTLRAIYGMLQPGGTIYLTVPAYQFLFSTDDRAAGHFRRYSGRSLGHVLAQAGFRVEYQGYFFMFLPLLILMFRTLPSWFKPDRVRQATSVSQDHKTSAMAGPLIAAALGWEARRIARGKRVIFGGSCLAVARKPPFKR
jgi:SAM-dependent methyltransferase